MSVVSMRSRRRQRVGDALDGLAQLALDLPGMQEHKVHAFIADVRPDVASEAKVGGYIVLDEVDSEHAVVIIDAKAKRPRLSMRLWAALLSCQGFNGYVRLDRNQLAARIGARPQHVSSCMTEMVRWNLLRREKGRPPKYFINPRIGGKFRTLDVREVQREAAPVLRFPELRPE